MEKLWADGNENINIYCERVSKKTKKKKMDEGKEGEVVVAAAAAKRVDATRRQEHAAGKT